MTAPMGPDIPAEIAVEIARVLREGRPRSLAPTNIASGFRLDIGATSARPVIGPVIGLVKKLVRRAIGWYVAPIALQLRDRQAALEGRIAQIGADLTIDVDSQEAARQGVEELRSRVAELAEAIKEVDRRAANAALGAARAPRPDQVSAAEPSAGARSWSAERVMDYLGFEDRFRGSVQEIRERQAGYVEEFRGLAPVLDVGCGRGEFLELLRDAGIDATGIDRHPGMIASCLAQGLRVEQAEALEYLANLEEGALGGIFCAQMIEHLDPPEIVTFTQLAFRALRDGGKFVVETINPRSLFVFSNAFYLDLGHLRPLHPYTLEFLCESAGFRETRTAYLSPPPAEIRPQHIETAGDATARLVERVNENFDRLDRIVFGPQDYACVATK